jgi:hypothetical protein
VRRVTAAVAGLAALLFATFAVRSAHACAGCRNPSLATSRGSQGELQAGYFRAGASLTGTTVHVVHEAGCADPDPAVCDEEPPQPTYMHDQHLYPVELRIAAEYGISELWGVELQLPFRAVTTTVEYTTPEGEPYEPLDPDVHHRDETVIGPVDPWLLARIGGFASKWWLAARPGVSIPLGKTQENPFALGDRGIRHQHIQLGTGTFDPVLALEASRKIDEWDVAFFAQGQASLYENKHGYRAPWRVAGGAMVGRDLLPKTNASLGLESFHEAAERWDGEIRQDGNLGRTELLGAVGARQTLGDDNQLSLSLRFSLWRKIVVGDEPPGTLSSPVVLSLAFTRVFDTSSP